MKEISVIIPVYNSERYIKACIDSLLSQTVRECMEVIFINDGSTDNSGNIINKAVFENENFSVYHIKHSGVSHARNTGIELAKGKYIAFIDADDYIENDYFESLLKEFDGEMTGGGFTAEYENKKIPHICKETTDFFGDDMIKEFLKESMISPIVADKLFLREKIGDLRFDESLSMAEDRMFLFEYLKKSNHIKVVPFGKYHYVMNENSACRKNFDERKFGSLEVSEKISAGINEKYPLLLPYAKSSEMDMKCRVYGEMVYFGVSEKYRDIFLKLKKEIHDFGIFEKFGYSSKKHFLAFVLAKTSPKLYMFLKNDMKLQYR